MAFASQIKVTLPNGRDSMKPHSRGRGYLYTSKYTFPIVLIYSNDLVGEGGLKMFNWK